jgi:REP element-mobilizing transposase RayT
MLYAIGKILCSEWQKIQTLRSNIVLDEYVIMPNHFHAIVEFVGAHCMRPEFPEFARAHFNRARATRPYGI